MPVRKRVTVFVRNCLFHFLYKQSSIRQVTLSQMDASSSVKHPIANFAGRWQN